MLRDSLTPIQEQDELFFRDSKDLKPEELPAFKPQVKVTSRSSNIIGAVAD
jgi:hypothetical protein